MGRRNSGVSSVTINDVKNTQNRFFIIYQENIRAKSFILANVVSKLVNFFKSKGINR
jgi:hypothetical protein